MTYIRINESAAPAGTGDGAPTNRGKFNLLRNEANVKNTDASISKCIPQPIKSVGRTLGYALWISSPRAWIGFQTVLTARLSTACRMLFLDRDDALLALTQAHSYAGPPIPPLISLMDEAAFWAGSAASEELDAYCLASFAQMRPARQTAFLEHVTRRLAA